MITKLVKSMPNNKKPNSSSGHRHSNILRGSQCNPSNSGDRFRSNFHRDSQCNPNNNGGSQCSPSNSGVNHRKVNKGENLKDHHSKIGCKYNLLNSLPGHLLEVRIMATAGKKSNSQGHLAFCWAIEQTGNATFPVCCGAKRMLPYGQCEACISLQMLSD